MSDRIGEQLGNYRLIRLLGQGSFADVYLGEHVYLNTQAAIKVLRTTLGEQDMEQFISEARTVARLKHPHIVRVLDFGLEGRTPFLVMEYASRGTMRDRYPRRTVLPLAAIRQYVQQIASALQYAHEQKLIHRDIKPENMLLGEHDELLLSDFGIATVAQSSRYENPGAIAGTGAYMAPEQLQGKPRPASDQYSLGVVIYEWLTGVLPFQGSFLEVASQHVLAPPPSLLERLPTLAPAIAEVVLIALSKEPTQRFASVQAFARAFEQACQQFGSPSSELTVPHKPSWPSLPPSQEQQGPSANSWMFAHTTMIRSNPPENVLGDLPTVVTDKNAVEQQAPRSGAAREVPQPPPKQPEHLPSRTGRSRAWSLIFIALSVVLIGSLTLAYFFVFRGPPQQRNTINISATKTALAKQPYQARIPGPGCDTGTAKWTSYGNGSMQCLADSLQLTGAAQQKFAVAFYGGNGGTTSWPVDYTVSVEVSSIQAGACVDLLDSIAPHDWYRIYLCSDNTASAQYDDGSQTTSLQSKSISPSNSFLLKISCTGSVYTFSVNGIQITSKDHGQIVSSMGIGLGAISGIANFKNFIFAPQS